MSTFSRASRLRLLTLFNRLDALQAVAERPAVFLTLTYGQASPTPHEAKERHLRVFWARLVRRWPGASAIWRMEPQRRGAVHFHLAVFGLPFVPWRVLRQWWEEVTAFQPYVNEVGVRVDHLRLKVESVGSWRRLAGYVSKYCAKVEDGAGFLVNGANVHAGRVWGVLNRKALPFAPRVALRFAHSRAVWQVQRVARRLYRGLFKFAPGFTLFSRNPWEVLRWAQACHQGV